MRVTHAERDQFERQQGWSIKKMYSSPNSQGPGDAAVAEIRGPAEEYAPVIFAQDAYKNVISFDMLSGAVREDLLAFVYKNLGGFVFSPTLKLARFILFSLGPAGRIKLQLLVLVMWFYSSAQPALLLVFY